MMLKTLILFVFSWCVACGLPITSLPGLNANLSFAQYQFYAIVLLWFLFKHELDIQGISQWIKHITEICFTGL